MTFKEIHRPSTVINKCHSFIYEIKTNDILVIPSAKSSYITFALAGEYYEDDSKTLELEQNVIYRIDNHDVDINDVSCPYKKRRHMTLLRTVKNEELNYSLCRAISNYHGISNLDSYSKQILNALYNYYGETRSIENLYPTMLRYLDYLKAKEKDGGYLTFGLGDWVYWKSTTNNTYTSTAYYYLDYTLMARFAGLLGKDAAPYRQRADELKALVNRKFFNPETGVYAEGTQTAQAIALYLGIVPEGKEQLVADKLCEVVRANNHFLDFGLLGSKSVPAMLTRYGYVEDAMKMITKTEAPSWGYWVETMGYTTLPETWTLSPEFRDASLNHVFMGDVSAWMMNQLAGINYDAVEPGFRHILITPHFVERVNWAKGEYHSVRGLISSEWKREGGKVTLTVTIPSGCTADIRVGDKTETVGSGTHVKTY